MVDLTQEAHVVGAGDAVADHLICPHIHPALDVEVGDVRHAFFDTACRVRH